MGRYATVGGVSGVGFLVLGLGLPKVIEDLPAVVSYGLTAAGGILLLTSFVWSMMNRGGAGGSSSTQSTAGPSSHNISGAQTVNIHHHGPPQSEPAAPAVSPWDDPNFSLTDRGLTGLARVMGASPPSGRRDTLIAEGILYVASRRWGGSFSAEAGRAMGPLGVAWQEVRQAAADGHIIVWGRPSPTSAHMMIPQYFWIDHQPEWFSLLGNEACTEGTDFGASSVRYSDLMVSRAQLQREWPPRWTKGDDDDDNGTSWKTI